MDLKPLEAKIDARGMLVEAFKFPNDGQVFYIISKPDEVRGNHFHLRKTEYFVVISGAATISSKNRVTGDIIHATIGGGKPMIVEIPPNHTHSITAKDEGCILIAWVDEQFNPDDPDTYREEL